MRHMLHPAPPNNQNVCNTRLNLLRKHPHGCLACPRLACAYLEPMMRTRNHLLLPALLQALAVVRNEAGEWQSLAGVHMVELRKNRCCDLLRSRYMQHPAIPILGVLLILQCFTAWRQKSTLTQVHTSRNCSYCLCAIAKPHWLVHR